MSKLGRNDPCHCGSGKKYKHCCLGKEPRVVTTADPVETGASPVLPSFGPTGGGWGAERGKGQPLGYGSSGIDVEIPDEPPATPIERAYDLAAQGWEVRGQARIDLARQALAESPDCVDAYILLASETATAEKAVVLYEQALAVADRVLGRDWWERHPKRDWLEPIAAESALDARIALGRALAQLGRTDEAIAQFRAVLTFDPDDDDGVRYYLLDTLLQADRDDEAMDLIDEYRGTVSSRWPFARALLKYRREGDTLWSRRALVDALAFNAGVAPYLLDMVPPPDESPLSDLLGGDSDALDAARNLDDDWRRTPGAIDWLKSIFDAGPDARLDAVPRGDGPTLCLTPSDAVGYIHCPVCKQKTAPRKREMVLLIEPDVLVGARLACRVCENCDLLSFLGRDVQRGAASVMRSRGFDQTRRDYVPLGIVDPSVAAERLAGTGDERWLYEHLLRWRDEVSPLPELDALLAGVDPDAEDILGAPEPAGVIDVPFSVGSR
jgi:tetratricopeptide (TPR) repeat protein